MTFELLTQDNVSKTVTCQFCGENCEAVIKHLKECSRSHIDSNDAFEAEKQYAQLFPGASLYTEKAYKSIAKKIGRDVKDDIQQKQKPEPVMKEDANSGIPAIDDNYVIPKKADNIIRMGYERNVPVYVFGMPGNGKTSLIEQFAARNNKPAIRVQHSGQIEDWEILGTERVNKEGSYYAEGLLAMAMTKGWIYIADEYDFAQPSVAANYQAVLEGKPLVIRGPNNGNNIVHPHKDFRFFATGNTNGAGDESGLFQGAKLQNAANMERFGIVYHLEGLGEEVENEILMKKTDADESLAKSIMEYVGMVRNSFKKGKISNTIGGVRVILNIAQNGIDLGDMAEGARLAFSNRLPGRDAAMCEEFAQRIWG